MVKKKSRSVVVLDGTWLVPLVLCLTLLNANSYKNFAAFATCDAENGNSTEVNVRNCTDTQDQIRNDTQRPYIQEITTTTTTTTTSPVLGNSSSHTSSDNSSTTMKTSRAMGFEDAADGDNNFPSAAMMMTSSTTTTIPSTSSIKEGRKINDDAEDLSDVTMDDDDNDDNTDDAARIVSQKAAKIVATKKKQEFHAGSGGSNKNSSVGQCEQGGLTYENGVKLEVDCDQVCTCDNGKMDCVDRCREPLRRKGLAKNQDPFCREVPSHEDKCCVVLQCTADTETEPLEICHYKGKSYNRGDLIQENCDEVCTYGVKCLKMECPTYFGTDVLDPNCIEWETVPPNFKPVAPVCCPEKLQCKNNGSCTYEDVMYQNWQQIPENVTGCDRRCYCEMGKVECQNVCPPVTPRAPKNLECPPERAKLTHLPGDDCCMYWKCSTVDPKDAANKTGINDVNEDEAEPGTDQQHMTVDQITTTTTTALPYPFQSAKPPSKTLGPLVVYENADKTQPNKVKPEENHFYETTKHNKKGDKYVPSTGHNDQVPYLGPFNPNFKPGKPHKADENYIPGNANNKNASPPPHVVTSDDHHDDHQHDDDDELLHIIHQHPEFANYPPGSVVEIHNVPNGHYPAGGANVIPIGVNANKNNKVQHGGGGGNNNAPENPDPDNVHNNKGLTLEQLLHELHSGQLTGHVPPYNNIAQPPPHLFAGRPNGQVPGLPPIGHYPGNGQHEESSVNVQILDAVDAHTVRLVFTVPRIIVGLHGRVEVRYTHRDDDDETSWELQIYAPPNDLIATQQLEFDLVELRADTEYKIRITVTPRDLPIRPTSKVHKIRTLKEIPSSTMPAMIPIEPDLVVTDVNATWVNVAWRKFTEYELQFIDGVQLRFKELDGKIYAATPLIHRAVTNYTLENLRPNARYEIGIFFIPFTGQHTELHSGHMWHFTTANEIDTYGFNVTLEISLIKATNVEISWSGVPYPEDKYVNIYRAIYQSDSGKGDSSTFKVAKRDSPPKSTIVDLKPGTRYRLWLEVYLTNGKIKTSNVQDFITKPRSAPNLGASSKQDKLSGSLHDEKGDYYGPLVIVAILAAIAILSTIVLLMILVRRHSQNKACITPPNRVSQSAYDNPTYKVEIQQETMDL